MRSGQQAPRTCRCIKTSKWRTVTIVCRIVSKHLAPAGALRRVGMFLAHSNVGVWQYSVFEFS